jgi:hypothetical protein
MFPAGYLCHALTKRHGSPPLRKVTTKSAGDVVR